MIIENTSCKIGDITHVNILFEDLEYSTVNSKSILIFNNLILLLRIYKFDIWDFNVQMICCRLRIYTYILYI